MSGARNEASFQHTTQQPVARDGLAVFSQPGQVQFDSPPHLAQEFRFCFGHGCYSRQIGAPGAVAAVIGTLPLNFPAPNAKANPHAQ